MNAKKRKRRKPSYIEKQMRLLAIALLVPVVIVYLTEINDMANRFSTALLGGTFFAALWYTVETRALRLHMIERMELDYHPWLSVDYMGSQSRDTGERTLESHEIVKFTIKNSGQTPAFNATICGQWSVKASHGAIQPNGEFEHQIGMIAPGQTGTFGVEIKYELMDNLFIEFNISYDAYRGGGGRLQYVYNYDNRQSSSLMENNFDFWTSRKEAKC